MSNPTPFYMNWFVNGIQVSGRVNGVVIDNPTFFDIGFPGESTEALVVTVRSSGLEQKTYNTLTNVKLFLYGDQETLQIVQELWPVLGASFFPARTELNGGVEISFDNGANYTRFTTEYGNYYNPSSWVTVPALSIGLAGTDGNLTSFDTASFIIRCIIPPGAVEFKKLKLGLGLDFDII